MRGKFLKSNNNNNNLRYIHLLYNFVCNIINNMHLENSLVEIGWNFISCWEKKCRNKITSEIIQWNNLINNCIQESKIQKQRFVPH